MEITLRKKQDSDLRHVFKTHSLWENALFIIY